MSQPTLDLTPLGTNTTNRTMSLIDSIPVEKMSEPTTLTQAKEFQEQNGKAPVPGDPDPDPSLSDLSSKKKKRDNKKKHNKKKGYDS